MHAGGAHASDATSRCGQRLATVALYDLRVLLVLEGRGNVLAVMVVVVDPSRHERGQAGARSACAWRDVACGGRLRRSGSQCRACGSKSTLVAVHRIEFCARGMPGTPWMRDGRVDWVQTIEPPPPPPPSWTMHGHPARPGRQCCVVRLCAVVTLANGDGHGDAAIERLRCWRACGCPPRPTTTMAPSPTCQQRRLRESCASHALGVERACTTIAHEWAIEGQREVRAKMMCGSKDTNPRGPSLGQEKWK